MDCHFSIRKTRLATNGERKDTFHQIVQRAINMNTVTTIQTKTTSEIDSK